MPLERFCAEKYAEIEALRTLEAAQALPAPYAGARPCFSTSLLGKGSGTGLPVIAEYKRASPSRGSINAHLSPEEVAAQYRDAGAACISVLTEEAHFQGRADFVPRMAALPHMPPLLRKDFIFHPLQVRATAASPASALLLMVRLTPDADRLRHLRTLAASLGLEAVVEVFTQEELVLARASGARLIQVNARDLATLSVDRHKALRMAEAHRGAGRDEIWIAASGVDSASQVNEARQAGFDAVLVGTSLMRGGNPGAALHRLLHGESTGDDV